SVASDLAIEDIDFDKGVAGEAPNGRLAVVFLLQLFGPQNLARICVEAVKMSLSPESIDVAIDHGWRAARPGRVRDSVRAVVSVLPNELTIFSVQTENSFLALNQTFLRSRRSRAGVRSVKVHHVNAMANDCGTGIAAEDRSAPDNLGPLRGERVD